jgi:hemoglobin
MTDQKTLYECIGGRPCLERVHKIFYNKLFSHPLLGQFFKNVKQETQEAQQTDFMSQPMGGPAVYSGKFPIPAHSHMYITEKIFNMRSQILRESIKEAGVSDDLAMRWLEIDSAFKNGIVKKSLEDCKPRYIGDEILVAVE